MKLVSSVLVLLLCLAASDDVHRLRGEATPSPDHIGQVFSESSGDAKPSEESSPGELESFGAKSRSGTEAASWYCASWEDCIDGRWNGEFICEACDGTKYCSLWLPRGRER
eukprot:CAMPEP_0114657458 /NCGR_PEP_ID=MMETSP0191-20121206/13971_1 /TAXON_ID=126664 /ORGANISM="Sorites sp." /LENGTH=110 /DNA_ID=CAMNT_0001876907 /DNA_START=77 /DNA_END=406 /DNA_ORIENTATION=-